MSAPDERTLPPPSPEAAVQDASRADSTDGADGSTVSLQPPTSGMFLSLPGSTAPFLNGAIGEPSGRFGGYDLVREIARGGMGVVYEAVQRGANRTVALKTILAGRLAGAEEIQRFLTEAEAAANLRHPGIVAIHEVGECDGRHFFSMDYVAGRSLSQLAKAQRPEVRRAARFVRDIAEAIGYAHDRGILHRDLKPSNVLVDADDRVHVTDFGLAKRVTGDSGLTQTGQILGTPSYMPPEQAAGSTSEVTVRSDVYSLGAVLYELLVGRPPFRGKSPLDTVLQVIEQPVVEPRRIEPDVPRDLETICLKCLEKAPAARYESAQALVEELDRFLKDEPIRARPVSRTERVWRWCRRNPTTAVLGGVSAALVLFLAVAGPLVAWRQSQLRATADEATAEAARREKDERTARDAADAAKGDAVAARDETRRNLYAARMLLGQEAVATPAGVPRLRQILKEWRPDPARPDVPDLRGWEWFLLSATVRRERLDVQVGSPMHSATWHPRRDLVACAGVGQVVLFAPETRQHVTTLETGPGFVFAARFDPTGRFLAYAGSQGELRIVDAQSFAEHRTLRVGRSIGALCWSPDGRRIALHVDDASIRIWEPETRQEVRTLTDHVAGQPGAFGFSPDGTKLAAAGWEGGGDFTVRVWNVADWSHLKTFHGHDRPVHAIDWSRDGKRIVSAGADQTVRTWDLAAGRELAVRRDHEQQVTSVAFSPDGKLLASGGWDFGVRLFDARTLEPVEVLAGHEARVTGLAWRPDGRLLGSVAEDGSMRLWDPETVPAATTLQHGGNSEDTRLESVAWHPGGDRFVTWLADSSRVWDAESLEPVLDLAVRFPCWNRDGTRLAGVADRNVVLWDAEGRRRLHEAPLPFDPGWDLMLHLAPDGRRVAVGNSEALWTWDAAGGSSPRRLLEGTPAARRIVWHPDGRAIARTHLDGHVRIVDAESGTILHDLVAETGRDNVVESIAWSADGTRLATSGGSRTIKLWDAGTWREQRVLSGHTGLVRSLAWSPDGKRLASGGEDHAVRVWDATHGLLVATFALRTPVGGVAWSPEGERLTALGTDGTIRLWDAAGGQDPDDGSQSQ